MASLSVLTEAAFLSQMGKSETLRIDARHMLVLPRPKCFEWLVSLIHGHMLKPERCGSSCEEVCSCFRDVTMKQAMTREMEARWGCISRSPTRQKAAENWTSQLNALLHVSFYHHVPLPPLSLEIYTVTKLGINVQA